MSFEDLDWASLRARRGKKWSTFDPDVLPAWVADMDFPVAEPIRRRLAEVLDTSDLGYPADGHPRRLAELLADRCARRHGWQVDPGRVEVIADVVQGLQMCLHLFTRPGEGALILTPIYPPFLHAAGAMGRRADCHTLEAGRDGYRIDWDRLEEQVADDTRVLLLCSPHNPTGRVFTREELGRLGELALRRDLVVVSDEIHCDLVYPGRTHVPFASLDPELEARTVTLMSATKAFNLAGLRGAMMVFGSREQQATYRDGPRFLRGAISSLGMHATEVAWTECEEWQAALLRHLEGNRRLIGERLEANLPQIGFHPPEATYLAWLDCRRLGLGEGLWRTVLDKGRLALNDGRDFGPGGEEFLRLNFATSTALLREALARLGRALA